MVVNVALYDLDGHELQTAIPLPLFRYITSLPSICIDVEGLCPVSKIKDDVSEPLTGHSLYYGEYTRAPSNIFILVFT